MWWAGSAKYVVPYLKFPPPLGIWFWQPSAYFVQTYSTFALNFPHYFGISNEMYFLLLTDFIFKFAFSGLKKWHVGFLTIVEGPSQPGTALSVTILSSGT